MKEFKYYTDNKIPLMNPAPEGFKFLGGKHDDITITVAQLFKDLGADDERRQLAASDKYFTE